MSYLAILRQIEGTASRTEKETILRNNATEELKKAMEYAMNPFKVYGIGKKSFHAAEPSQEFADLFALLDWLLEHPNGSDEAKAKASGFLAAHPEQDREMLRRILLKDLRIGITESTVNKVLGPIVPTFTCQLAQPIEERKLPEGVEVEPKYDGVRILAVKQNGVVVLHTRNGKVVEGFEDVEATLKNVKLDNVVFDGEVVGDSYKDTMEKLFRKSGKKQGTYMVFDCIPLEKFQQGSSAIPYYQRRNRLSEILPSTPAVRVVPSYGIFEGVTIESLRKIMDRAVLDGFEGIMIKDLRALYRCKRTYDWQKMKPFESDEFAVIGFREGEGKYQGTLGAVVVMVGETQVEVGSGWTDEDRREIWNNKEKYLRQMLEVQYQERIAKTGSLRFPVAKGFRYDK